MSTLEEQLADAYNEGYDEARTTCQECIVEFQRGLQWGLTIARARLLEAESLQDADRILGECIAVQRSNEQ